MFVLESESEKITRSNTVSFIQNGKNITVTGYQARAGYNLVTGVGTIDAARFIEDLQELEGEQ